MDTQAVVRTLKGEGFILSPGYIRWVIAEGHIPAPEVKVGSAFLWAEGDIDRLRQFLRRQGHGPVAGNR